MKYDADKTFSQARAQKHIWVQSIAFARANDQAMLVLTSIIKHLIVETGAHLHGTF